MPQARAADLFEAYVGALWKCAQADGSGQKHRELTKLFNELWDPKVWRALSDVSTSLSDVPPPYHLQANSDDPSHDHSGRVYRALPSKKLPAPQQHVATPFDQYQPFFLPQYPQPPQYFHYPMYPPFQFGQPLAFGQNPDFGFTFAMSNNITQPAPPTAIPQRTKKQRRRR